MSAHVHPSRRVASVFCDSVGGSCGSNASPDKGLAARLVARALPPWQRLEVRVGNCENSSCARDGRMVSSLSLQVSSTGWWRSLVAHLTGGQGVAGSNPVHPTRNLRGRANYRSAFFISGSSAIVLVARHRAWGPASCGTEYRVGHDPRAAARFAERSDSFFLRTFRLLGMRVAPTRNLVPRSPVRRLSSFLDFLLPCFGLPDVWPSSFSLPWLGNPVSPSPVFLASPVRRHPHTERRRTFAEYATHAGQEPVTLA